MTATREMLLQAENNSSYYNGESAFKPGKACTYWVCKNPHYDESLLYDDSDLRKADEKIIFEWLTTDLSDEESEVFSSDGLTDAEISTMEAYVK